MKIVFEGIASQDLQDTIEEVKRYLASEKIKIYLGMADREKKKLTGEDLLVTFDLSGFENQTLAGSISYNLLNCKQIHILLRENPVQEEKLAKPLSIAMFFFCRGQAYYQKLKGLYPEVPYLEEIPKWNGESGKDASRDNAKLLVGIIGKVAKLCGLREFS